MSSASSPALRHPSFLLRTSALAIDCGLFLVLYLPIEFLLVGSLRREVVWSSVYAASAILLLYGLSEIVFAATPGKLLLRLRIRSATGQAAGSGVLFLRYLIKYSPRILGLAGALLLSPTARQLVAWLGLTPFRDKPLELTTLRTLTELALIAIAGGYFLALRDRRQTLHDQLSQTSVYRLSPSANRLAFEPILAEVIPDQAPANEAPSITRWSDRLTPISAEKSG